MRKFRTDGKRMHKTAVFFSALILGAALLTGCGKKTEPPQESETQTKQETVSATEQAKANETGAVTNTQQAALVENDGQHSYLTGEKMDPEQVKQRPLAVMLNNILEGCPQTGTSKASIIYEAPVEGRITRLMGLFENYGDMDKIGYIRSSRDYFVYCALEFDAIYAHFGQATPYVGGLLNSDRVDNISGPVAGINHPAPNTFLRTTERKMPHNVYLDIKGLQKDIDKMKYSRTYHDAHKTKFAFAADGQKPDNSKGKTAEMLYPGGKEKDQPNGYSKVQAWFEYNEEDGKYYRYQYGGPHIDESTGEQIAFDNVIFQYCYGEVRDENDYLAFGCHGDNGMKVQVFTQGKMTEGTWSRYADTDPAYYVDENGDPIVLSQGKTWICLIWDQYADDVVIE